MIYKILHKLGLGETAYKVLKPFTKRKCELPSLQEALELLSSIDADAGQSCITQEALPPESGMALDVIIPAYNAEKFLRESIDSVLEQKTSCCFGVIVVDDGSMDATGAILDEYAQSGKIRLLHQENRGAAAARNAGLRMSGAEYVMFHDADDVMNEGAIEELMKLAEEENAAVVGGAYCAIRENGGRMFGTKQESGRIYDQAKCNGLPCGRVFRRSLFDGVQFPEGYWYEDSVVYQVLLPLAFAAEGGVYGISAEIFSYRSNPRGATQGWNSRQKSIDSLWVTLRLYEDRKRLGIERTQDYGRYILSMINLTYRRTHGLPENIRKAIFVVWADFLEREFKDFDCRGDRRETLKKLMDTHDYEAYELYCRLHK